ncbi:MAG: SpoIIE family protein phosphatase [Clostridia bacterium]|nr:SpoIIE family protein phosphatase [Clostridia bacterium]MDD4386724.1 SpoIIE family protein phosphatase [Clostridia bacterium]
MVYNEYLEDDILDNDMSHTSQIKKNIVSFKTIVFIVLSIILSMQTLTGGLNPFGYVMLGVASIFNVPLLAVFLSSVLGMIISAFSITEIISLTLFFVIFTFFTVMINVEGISRKYSAMIKLILSVSIVKIINLLLIKDLTIVLSIYEILLVAILYIVFLSGIYVILNYKKGYVFSQEENIAMLCIIAFLIAGLRYTSILDISVMNIFGIACVLIYGWKNGPILGCCSGLIIGLIISSLGQTNLTYIVTLAFSGMLAGLLGKIGKIAVIIGFVAGTFVVNYFVGSSSYFSTTLIEILIASIPLLFMPKKLEKKINEFFNINSTLKSSYENLLDFGSDVRNRLDAVSGVFNSLSEITLETTSEDKIETREVIQRYIEDYAHNNCIGCAKKYECIGDENLKMSVDYISSKLENKEDISNSMLNVKCEESTKIIKDINEVYSSMKIMRMLKKKEEETSKKLSKQYKEVSNIISNISKNIKNVPAKSEKNVKNLRDELKLHGYMVYEDDFNIDNNYIEYTFITDILNDIDKQKKEIIKLVSNMLEKPMHIKLLLNISKSERSRIKLVSMPKYSLEVGIAKSCKTNELISGDSYLSMDLGISKYMSAISDGAGSGPEAEKSSKIVIDMLEKLLKGGFEKDKAIQIINTIIKMKQDENNFATLDIVIADLENGEAEYIKLGAAPTYIIQNGKIITISSCNIPVGLINDNEYVPISKKLNKQDIILQISDGIVNDDMNINDNYFTKILTNIDTSRTSREIANELHKHVLKEFKNVLHDDITIVVSKFGNSQVLY